MSLTFFHRKEARKTDKFAQYAMVASDEAIIDAKLDLDTIDKFRVGVIWGAGIGGIDTFQTEVPILQQVTAHHVSIHFLFPK